MQHTPSPRPVVRAGQPDPAWIALQDAEDEERASARAVDRYRGKLAEAEIRHHRARGNATFARIKWILKGGKA